MEQMWSRIATLCPGEHFGDRRPLLRLSLGELLNRRPDRLPIGHRRLLVGAVEDVAHEPPLRVR